MIKFWHRKGKDIGVDLGTANTRIYTKEKGITIDEPTVVAVNTKTEQILAVGDEAKQMLGKTPAHILVTRPLQHGIISDYEVAEKMLRYFIDKVHDGGLSMLSRPRVIVGVPLDVTEVEAKAVEDAIIAAGAREVFIVQEPMLAAIGGRMPIEDPVGNFLVDIGAGKTEVAVISLHGVVTWKSTPIAGEEMNKNIVQYAREVFNLFVGESHAEYIKMKVGAVMAGPEILQIPMRGRDVISGLPKETMITDAHIREALDRSVRTIIDHIKMTLEVTPPELTADIHERGMLLTGGGALISGLDTMIAKATDIPVRIADDPLSAVVRGTAVLLENPALLELVRLPSARQSIRS